MVLVVKSIDVRCVCADVGGDRVGGMVVAADEADDVRVAFAPLWCFRPFDSDRDVPQTYVSKKIRFHFLDIFQTISNY